MFATYLGTCIGVATDAPSPQPGNLVLVEVPPNCTIHDEDAARLASLRTIASELRDAIKTGKGEGIILRLAYGVSEFADISDAEKAGGTAALVRPTMESLSR